MNECLKNDVIFSYPKSIIEGLFWFGNKCKSPFSSTFDDQYFGRIWSGLFKCPYDPEEDPTLVSKIGMFVRYFYMTSGQTTYQESSVFDMAQLINPDYPVFIILHGFTDGVKPGGIPAREKNG